MQRDRDPPSGRGPAGEERQAARGVWHLRVLRGRQQFRPRQAGEGGPGAGRGRQGEGAPEDTGGEGAAGREGQGGALRACAHAQSGTTGKGGTGGQKEEEKV